MNRKNTLFKIIVAIIILILIATIGQSFLIKKEPAEKAAQEEVTQNEIAAERKEAASGKITIEEIAKHNTAEDCWLLIDNKVYDVTSYVNSHPGGKTILEGCGMDATILFNTKPMGSGTPHSESANTNLQNFLIGEII